MLAGPKLLLSLEAHRDHCVVFKPVSAGKRQVYRLNCANQLRIQSRPFRISAADVA